LPLGRRDFVSKTGNWSAFMVIKILLSMLTLFFLNGCVGTLYTRFEGSFAGKYPYQGVVVDCKLVSETSDTSILDPVFISIMCIPIDLVADTLLAPFDLIFWPMGFEKKEPGPNSFK
jgi:uncharacterized protein YceK